MDPNTATSPDLYPELAHPEAVVASPEPDSNADSLSRYSIPVEA